MAKYDIQKLKAELIAENQLSDFLDAVEFTTPLFNCNTIQAFPEGPNGPDNQGNLFLRHNTLCERGAVLDGHCHPFPHTSIIFGGPMLLERSYVDADGQKCGPRIPGCVVGEGPPGTFANIYIPANMWHKFTTLRKGATLICIYAVRNSATGAFADQFDGSGYPYGQREKPWPVV